MNSGLAYTNVHIYRLVMRFLYGDEYHRKYAAVAALIPRDASVCDLCAGDCMLARIHPETTDRYLALDLNPRFVTADHRSGINARWFDARTQEIPAADVVCLQSSLYQFNPEDDRMVRRM